MIYNKKNPLSSLKENYNDLFLDLNLDFNKGKQEVNIDNFKKNILLNLEHFNCENLSLIINIHNNNNNNTLNIFEYFSSVANNLKEINMTINVHDEFYLTYTSICENINNLRIVRNFYLLAKTKLEYMCGNFGANIKSNTQINIKEEYTEVNSKTFMISSNNSKQKHTIDIKHLAKNSFSEMNNYGVVLNTCVGEFENIGFIEKGCCGSNAQQESKIITLGDKSQANVHPILLIDEYDVMAGHAGSVGKVSKEQLFYLMSRGLSEKDSYILIIEGFFKPLLYNLKDEKLKIEIEEIVRKKILKG